MDTFMELDILIQLGLVLGAFTLIAGGIVVYLSNNEKPKKYRSPK